MKQKNTNLNQAKDVINDEFYTQLPDIERELKNYKKHFRNKTVYCNCDDPRVSNFFHYFSYNFEKLGLKKLIATCYKNQNIDLFSKRKAEQAVYLEYEGDKNKSGMPELSEIDVIKLNGDGDFRSRESIDLLKKSDIVVTNPPFSLFREYILQLMEYEKKFVVIGSQNAVTYREIFDLIKNNKLWFGYGFKAGNAFFKTPTDKNFAKGVFDEETGLVKFRNVTWYTNLDISKRHEELILYKTYKGNETEYPEFDNYKAISISKVAEIPSDYKGIMGVPITFIEKYNPDQFEIIGSDYDVKEGLIKNIIKPNWTGKVDRAYLNGKRMYARLLIKRK